jgi:MOSC domain-containing protein YiiM
MERPCPDWPLDRVWRLLYQDPADRDGLAALAELTVLAQGWREMARKHLESGQPESLRQRLGRLLGE